jgi:hypothetical protein
MYLFIYIYIMLSAHVNHVEWALFSVRSFDLQEDEERTGRRREGRGVGERFQNVEKEGKMELNRQCVVCE